MRAISQGSSARGCTCSPEVWGVMVTQEIGVDLLTHFRGSSQGQEALQYFLFCRPAFPASSDILAQASKPPLHFRLSRQLKIRTTSILSLHQVTPANRIPGVEISARRLGPGCVCVFRSPSPPPIASEPTKQPHPKHSLFLHLQQTASLAPQEEVLMRKAVGQDCACLRL